MLIEANEEGWLAMQLLQEGQEAPVGQPIALLCEEEEQLEQAAQQAPAVQQYSNVYQSEQEPGRHIRTMVWQSYLKESNKEPGSNCGCM